MHLHFFENATETILLVFIIIVFLQSGIDKVTDWGGNLSWLKGHFSKSPFKNSVPLLLGIITVMELAAGLLSLVGSVHLLLHDNGGFAFYGALLACISLLMLLLGQRVAKDYEGAKTIVIYLVPAAFLLFLLQ
ncbi:DoxX family protein [Allomuricauda sp. SCSIO 65647]|uniref:DoxX family protein n=1 Tax=Allomuricauda sp. SCSIO 65647 TaxID=2908843 RepID=UPI001F43AF06|nr:DoxX family protein [Muricauda sp. SCSIO 65647]UJH69058.1 DoxX family protein [Muricauda sp. SCSIO 65647]